jgi:hypothetical protein
MQLAALRSAQLINQCDFPGCEKHCPNLPASVFEHIGAPPTYLTVYLPIQQAELPGSRKSPKAFFTNCFRYAPSAHPPFIRTPKDCKVFRREIYKFAI